MTEHELEVLLRRYRPAGPPPDLRARIVAGVASAQRTWSWAAAAAVVLAAIWLTQLSTRNVYEHVGESLGSAHTSVLQNFPALESAAENDPLLRMRLETLAYQEQSATAPTADATGPS